MLKKIFNPKNQKFLRRNSKKFQYESLFQLSKDTTPYRLITKDFISTIEVTDSKTGEKKEILKIEPEAIEKLTGEAMSDISYLLRPAHLKQLSNFK
jgi:fumarate hydratase, class I